jgi:hypothetical protein
MFSAEPDLPGKPDQPLSDRARWNRKYSCAQPPALPSGVVLEMEPYLPKHGRALDVAGGAGRHAIWLAQRGLDVTLADVSDVAIEQAALRAAAAQVKICPIRVDLLDEPFPAGPWDLIMSVLYLQRSLFPEYLRNLRIGGTLLVVQPTTVNLERHDKPPRDFLLQPEELRRLVSGLELVFYREDWSRDGRHDAVTVVRRITQSRVGRGQAFCCASVGASNVSPNQRLSSG